MQDGAERREQTGALPPVQHDLAAGMQRTGGVDRANTPAYQPSSYNQRLLDQLAKVGGGRARSAANAQYKKDYLAGQLAQQQGKAIDDTEFKGKPWAMEGWRAMQAQQTVAGLHAAAREEIAQIGYQQTPEEFSKNWNDRLAQALDGQDPRVQDMITEAASKGMPDLVAMHTSSHAKWSEQQNFDEFKNTLAVSAEAPGAVDLYVQYAEGTGAAEGLSPERRKQAVYEAIRDSLLKGDVKPYLIAMSDERIKNAMDAQQFAELRNQKKAYDGHRREEINVKYLEAEDAIMSKAAAGGYANAQEAVDELVALNEQYNLDTSQQEASVVFGAVKTGNNQKAATVGADLEAYSAAGDYATVARISGNVIQQIESSGGRNVVGQPVASHGGDRAYGNWQVMPSTAANPSLPAWGRTGFKGKQIAPAKDNSLAEYNRVGQEYWEGLVEMFAGDAEAAALAHHSGFGTAQQWVEGGKLMSFFDGRPNGLDYINKFRKHIGGTMTPDMWRDRSLAQRQRVMEDHEVRIYEQYAPELERIQEAVVSGSMPYQAGIEELRAVQAELGMARTKDSIDTELDMLSDLRSAQNEAFKSAGDASYQNWVMQRDTADAAFDEAYQAQLRIVEAAPADQVDAEAAKLPQMLQEHTETMLGLAAEQGVVLTPKQMAQENREFLDKMRGARKQAQDAKLSAQKIAMAQSQVGGYDTLTDAEKKHGFTMQQNSIDQQATRMLKEGKFDSEDQAKDWAGAQMNAWSAKTGYFPDSMKSMAAMSINGPLIDDKTGAPNPAAMQTLMTYQDVRRQNPAAADRLFDNEADRVRAGMILDMAGNSEMNLASAMLNVHNDKRDLPTKSEELRKQMTSDAVQKDIRRATAAVLEDDEFFQLAGINLMREPGRGVNDRSAAMDELAPVVENEYRRLLLLNPTGTPKWLKQQVQRNIAARTASVGGHLIVAPQGQTINSMVFGDQLVDNPKAGVQAIEAEIQRMADLKTADGASVYPFLSDGTGALGQLRRGLSGPTAEGVGAVGEVLHGLVTGDFEGAADAAVGSSVRPYTITINPNGYAYITWDMGSPGFLAIRGDERGPTEPVAVNLRAAGENWIADQ